MSGSARCTSATNSCGVAVPGPVRTGGAPGAGRTSTLAILKFFGSCGIVLTITPWRCDANVLAVALTAVLLPPYRLLPSDATARALRMQPRRSIVLDMTTTGTLADLAAQARALIVTGQARELRLRAGYALTDAAKASGGVHASAVLRWE